MPRGRADAASGMWIAEYDAFGSEINLVTGADAPLKKDACARAFTVVKCVDDDILEVFMANGTAVQLTLRTGLIGFTVQQNIAGIGTNTSAGVVVWVQW